MDIVKLQKPPASQLTTEKLHFIFIVTSINHGKIPVHSYS